MRLFHLTKPDACISESQIFEIVFLWRINILASFHIIAHCLSNQKRLLQHLQILLDGVLAYSDTLNRLKRILYLRRVCKSSYTGSHYIYQFTHYITSPNMITFLDVRQIGLFKQSFQIRFLLFYIGFQTNHRQAPVCHILIQSFLISHFWMCIEKLTH